MAGRLEGKVAIITGASSGLGPVLARMFVDEGARVVISARREEPVQQVAREIGPGALAIRADVTSEEDVAAMVSLALDEFGQVDVMCNNASLPGTDMFVWDQTLDNWNATFAAVVTGPMLCTREVLRRSMLERRSGVILNFSSGAGFRGHPRKSHYVTAKASLRAFTKNVALEVGEYGIRCNCIVPGLIDTEVFRAFIGRIAREQDITEEALLATMVKDRPLQRTCTPEDVAQLAIFLASEESRNITGQSIPVDSGGYMQG